MLHENLKSAIFSGDSFTWGEGLDLYVEDDFWISQRLQNNDWINLQNKITEESSEFREKNRFAGLVSSYFDIDGFVKKTNGGQFENLFNFVESNLKTTIPDFIILQFTCLERSNLHLETDCNCDFCLSTGNDKPHYFLHRLLQKKLNNQEFTEKDIIAINYLKNNEGIDIIKIIDSEKYQIADLFESIYSKYFYRNIEIFVKKYLNRWLEFCPVYFIDSWSPYTSNVINRFDEIKKRIIPLEGENGRKYKNYSDFKKSFKYESIMQEFAESNNGHPTLLQHKLIAKSIIQYIEKNFVPIKKFI
jgi:hypothetical protein